MRMVKKMSENKSYFLQKVKVAAAMFTFALAGAVGLAGMSARAEGENLIEDPFFQEGEDIGVWSAAQGGAQITALKSEENIYGMVNTYGMISGRTSNYECFAQDITGKVEAGKLYDFSFYVMLDAEDYAEAEADMRTVEISPFYTINGETTYSQGVTGTVSQVLEPGVWTKFSGIYSPSWNGEPEQVVIRLLEQGTNYGQGAGVMGNYYVTGVVLKEQSEEEPEIQMDVPVLWKSVQDELNDSDFIMGTAICNSDLSDRKEMALVKRHFNAITLGNELKPDSMFGYSNNVVPGTETAVLNGEEITVPKMDYSRAEKTLNYIYDYNQAHPEAPIRVRGHVLVWHSQTPEWWFHEDYDAKKPYADTDTMNKRLEWYIKTMAEHFTGPDSKYHGMFYGWDVVNEAVSDGSGTYRSSTENSSWWAVYGSNEFIINAFRFANKYMDPDVALFYNDYNDCYANKRKGILQLLKDVKEAEGTRIDGMGMQAHYQTEATPTITEVMESARAYAQVVDQIQFTEFDIGSSASYDGSDESKAAEFSTGGYRYRAFYEAVMQLRKEGINFTGFTVWGVVDKYSWLQSRSNVGGGSDGKRKQCPLLFDDDYNVKPAYWAFVDPSRLTPVAKRVSIIESIGGGSLKGAKEISFAGGEVSVTCKPVWSGSNLTMKISVTDATEEAGDYVEVFASDSTGNIYKAEFLRENAAAKINLYESSVKFTLNEADMAVDGQIRFDIVIHDGDSRIAYSDNTFSQETTTEYYATATLIANPDAPKPEKEKPSLEHSSDKTKEESKAESTQEEPEQEKEQESAESDKQEEDGEDGEKLTKEASKVSGALIAGVMAVAAAGAVGAAVVVRKNSRENKLTNTNEAINEAVNEAENEAENQAEQEAEQVAQQVAQQEIQQEAEEVNEEELDAAIYSLTEKLNNKPKQKTNTKNKENNHKNRLSNQ